MQVDYIMHMGSDLLVVNAARVSFNKWKDEFDDRDERLIQFLGEHEHVSPFFHPQVCLRVAAPIYVARQLYRHEVGGVKNEVSRRYVTYEPVLEMPELFRGKPVGGAKQGSYGVLSEPQQTEAHKLTQRVFDLTREAYQALLEMGVAPEQARIVLPLALETIWIWTGSLAFFARVCRHRLQADAQEETQVIAQAIDQIIRPLFPVAWREALK